MIAVGLDWSACRDDVSGPVSGQMAWYRQAVVGLAMIAVGLDWSACRDDVSGPVSGQVALFARR